MTLPYVEYPMFFPSGEETLFGVLTEPEGEPNGVDVLAICGGGWIPGPHRGSMWVRLARAYAASGYRTFRFDYHGVGESTGNVRFDMDLPQTQDAGAALDRLSRGSSGKQVLVGTCFGGRTAGALAAVRQPAGVAFLAVPVLGAKSTGELMKSAASPRVIRNIFKADHRRQYWKIIVRRSKRILNRVRSKGSHAIEGKRRFIDDFEVLVQKRVPCLLAYGAEDPEYAQFLEEAKGGRLARALERAGDLAQVVVVPGRMHGFASAEAQSHVIAVVEAWLEDHIRPAVTG